MKATESGRVIGKALTEFSGEGQGTVVVFIQNTYYDGINELDYADSQMLSGGVLTNPFALDRFSFMVNKSLAKIDPLLASGSMVNFTSTITSLASSMNSISGSLTDITTQYSGLSGNVHTLLDQFLSLSGTVSDIRTHLNDTSSNQGTNISTENQSVLDAIIGTINSLIIEVGVTFQEIATFMKSVVFQSTVTFQNRVTFEDTDMAGTAIIQAGSKSVHINFNTTYTTVPKITVTGDTFVNYRVTGKSIHGFTIETQLPVTENTSFDWIALMVQ